MNSAIGLARTFASISQLIPGGPWNYPLLSSAGCYCGSKTSDPVAIISGSQKSAIGLIDSAVFQRTVNYRDEYAPVN